MNYLNMYKIATQNVLCSWISLQYPSIYQVVHVFYNYISFDSTALKVLYCG